MLSLIRNVSESGLEALETQAALITQRVRHASIVAAAWMAAGLVGGFAVCALLAGVTWLMSDWIGLRAAVLLMSFAVVSACAGGSWLAYREVRGNLDAARDAANRASASLHKAINPTENEPGVSGDGGANASPVEDAIAAAASNPQLVSSALFAVASVVGVRRSIALLRTASALASAGAIAGRAASLRNGCVGER